MTDREPVTVYRCRVCSERKHIPGQRPLHPEPSISVGCPSCERIRSFVAPGVGR